MNMNDKEFYLLINHKDKVICKSMLFPLVLVKADSRKNFELR
jgi:hypothetical protein